MRAQLQLAVGCLQILVALFGQRRVLDGLPELFSAPHNPQ
jgi:hypothetical protein